MRMKRAKENRLSEAYGGVDFQRSEKTLQDDGEQDWDMKDACTNLHLPDASRAVHVAT